jgi:cephalosporin hydroxylase
MAKLHMFPFWDLVIAPVFDAIDPRRVVEIGALRGENTVQMLTHLGPDAELHVIDPAPEFDPTEQEREFAGRYIFHRALSHDVLGDLPVMDIALIDGDHNWYTVYHELRLLSGVARKADAPLPVMMLHDVCWPYGRRDLYYAPDTIPAEFRQEFEQKGIGLNRSPLVDNGGLNPTMYNAIEEGGPRNGVMTAIEDFIAEYDKPLRHLLLPIYFGLSIIVEEEYLDSQPALRAVLDRLESGEGRADLLELAEQTRLRAMLTQHNVFFQREKQQKRAVARYLDLLKGALLDEHYLENELRIHHLATSLMAGKQPEVNKIRDPWHEMRQRQKELLNDRRSGLLAADQSETIPSYFPLTTMGRVRLDDLHASMDLLHEANVRGDYVECGTGRGGGAIFMRGHLRITDRPYPQVWVADRFRSTSEDPAENTTPIPGGGLGFPDLQPDLNTVRDAFDRFGFLDNRVHFLQGRYTDTLPEAPIEKVALLRIGMGTGEEAADVLDHIYDKVVLGGIVIIEDYRDPTTQKAVDEFRARRGIDEQIERVDWVAARWRKLQHRSTPDAESAVTNDVAGDVTAAAAVPARPPLAPAAPSKPKDLTVVVCFYNMKREAERSLHALSRAYQQDMEKVDYEVIVVENGSSPEQHLGEEFVRRFGPEFRYLDMGDDARPSPIPALNRGIALGAGRNFALMIDGAHVLTPGVLRFGLTGLKTYEPAIVLTQQWYVGPGQQPSAVANGYTKEYEDQLFEEIAWPNDGYALFDIGHFIGDRDWFDGMWESNCMFVPRTTLRQVGCFDEGFTTPGGGYANLDLYERLGSDPKVNVTTILGEGSFHQVHGGTTTNQLVVDDRNTGLADYAQDYAEKRGRPFSGPGRTIHYVGTMSSRAMRTKARRRTAPHLWKPRMPDDPDGVPTSPTPIPSELNDQYTDAFWSNLAWKKVSWLGRPVQLPPNDLLLYQEIMHRVQPDWVVELGTGSGGRALFLASICDMVDHGRVLSVDTSRAEGWPEHDRIQYLTGKSLESETIQQVHDLLGTSPHGLLVIGSRSGTSRTVQEFDAYQDIVSSGSYAIIEFTVVNGHPVWPTFGQGPMEAAKRIINRRGDFTDDASLTKFGVSFNPHGYLKRISRSEA